MISTVDVIKSQHYNLCWKRRGEREYHKYIIWNENPLEENKKLLEDAEVR
jgi:hypothetical protein